MVEQSVSVVVPVCNGKRFLAAALDSVIAQSRAPLETIVVDDGSSDGGARIAAPYPGVSVIRQGNRGVAAARNTGLELARGEWVAFLDQDDEWHPEKLERQLAAVARDPEISVVLSYLDMVLESGTPRPDWFPIRWLTEPQPGFIPSTWLVRRHAFERVGKFDTGYAIACDADWLARAKDAGLRTHMLEDALVSWRVHGANASYDRAVMGQEAMRVLRETVRRQREAAHAG